MIDWDPLIARLPALQRPTGKRVIVVAPHADDETLGVGGAIYDWTKGGLDVRVLIATDGGRSHDHPEIIGIRRREALVAAGYLGVAEQLSFLDIADGELELHIETLSTAINDLVPGGEPTLIVAPRIGDGHSDHEAASRAANLVAFRRGPLVEVWGYGVWSWVNETTATLLDGCLRWDMSNEAYGAKQLAIQAYQSQISATLGVQIVTDELLAATSGSAEVFWCSPVSQAKGLMHD